MFPCAFVQIISAALCWVMGALFVSSLGSSLEKVKKDRWKSMVIVISLAAVSVVTAKSIGDGVYTLVLFPFLLLGAAL